MARRKRSRQPLNSNLVRQISIVVIVAIMIFFGVTSLSSFLGHSPLFRVREIVLSESLQGLDIPDFRNLQGKNIFSVDLAWLESRIRARHPLVGGLKVLRQFPDRIVVSGFYREAVALAAFDRGAWVVSRDGYIIGPASADAGPLPLIKGLRRQKAVLGSSVVDKNLEEAYGLLEVIFKDPILAHADLRSVDIGDPDKIVCVFGKDIVGFDVFVDRDKSLTQLNLLSTILGRGDLDLSGVQYIDLRFDETIIGKKKRRL